MSHAQSCSARRRIVAATHNPGKVQELKALLAPIGFEVVSAGELGLPEPEETGETFAANAALKAQAAASGAGLLALADDSGLEVAALGGAPGVYSARWGGPSKDFGLAMRRVQEELERVEAKDRTARFVCALALSEPGRETRVFEGTVDGEVVWPPRGALGFGYDPIFRPLGFEQTFAEMPPAEKHAMSHRARAFALLRSCLA